MNKIVRRHYPAEKLPQELREGIPDGALVEIIVTQEERQQKSKAELLEMARKIPKGLSDPQEAVRRIRELRNEWDD